MNPGLNPRFASLAVVATLCTLPASADAQLPGQAGFRTQAQQREELIGKLRRDIAKVAHSVEVTKELIARSRGAPFLPDIYLRLAELYVEQGPIRVLSRSRDAGANPARGPRSRPRRSSSKRRPSRRISVSCPSSQSSKTPTRSSSSWRTSIASSAPTRK